MVSGFSWLQGRATDFLFKFYQVFGKFFEGEVQIVWEKHLTINNCFHLLTALFLFGADLSIMDFDAIPDDRINEDSVFIFERLRTCE